MVAAVVAAQIKGVEQGGSGCGGGTLHNGVSYERLHRCQLRTFDARLTHVQPADSLSVDCGSITRDTPTGNGGAAVTAAASSRIVTYRRVSSHP